MRFSPSGILRTKFKSWRKKNKKTLRWCEKRLGMSNAFLSQFETGKVSISYDNAIKLLKLIGEL